jgi:predicted protein tyrosine phosphatase
MIFCFDCKGKTSHDEGCPVLVNFSPHWDHIFREFKIPMSTKYVGFSKRGPQDRVLCICRGGNTRSIAASFLLKYKYGCEALAIGMEKTTPETLSLLLQWSTAVLVFDKEAHRRIMMVRGWQHVRTFHFVPLGHDVWTNPLDMDLLRKCDEYLRQWFMPNLNPVVEEK